MPSIHSAISHPSRMLNPTKCGATTKPKVIPQQVSSANALVSAVAMNLYGAGGRVTSTNNVGKFKQQSTPPDADVVNMNLPSKDSTTPPLWSGWQHVETWFANMRRCGRECVHALCVTSCLRTYEDPARRRARSSSPMREGVPPMPMGSPDAEDTNHLRGVLQIVFAHAMPPDEDPGRLCRWTMGCSCHQSMILFHANKTTSHGNSPSPAASANET